MSASRFGDVMKSTSGVIEFGGKCRSIAANPSTLMAESGIDLRVVVVEPHQAHAAGQR